MCKKQIVSVLIFFYLICLLAAGCSDKKPAEAGNGASDSIESASPGDPQDGSGDESSEPFDMQGSISSSAENSGPETQEGSASGPAAAAGVDVDLTAMSSTMVYAEVYNMLMDPGLYMGKTVRMSGPYYASYYDETGKYYHYVIIEDATACCQQGMEFIWNGDHVYPSDYPEDFTRIEVTGTFEYYEELDYPYYYLAVDGITIL